MCLAIENEYVNKFIKQIIRIFRSFPLNKANEIFDEIKCTFSLPPADTTLGDLRDIHISFIKTLISENIKNNIANNIHQIDKNIEDVYDAENEKLVIKYYENFSEIISDWIHMLK